MATRHPGAELPGDAYRLEMSTCSQTTIWHDWSPGKGHAFANDLSCHCR
jgi:hypothetical protein